MVDHSWKSKSHWGFLSHWLPLAYFSPTCDYLEIAINGLSTSKEEFLKNTTTSGKKRSKIPNNHLHKLDKNMGWWLSGKESGCQCKRCRFDPWVRKSPWRRKCQPTPVFLPGKSQEQRSLVGYSPWDGKRIGHNLVTKYHATTTKES